MKSVSAIFAAFLLLGGSQARAQEYDPGQNMQPGDNNMAQPPSAAPTDVPPVPPQQPGVPPEQQQAQAYSGQAQVPVQAQPAATGQWVYTQQYGWVWMPYGSQYTYYPTGGGAYPSEYVYYPSYGWTWVVAPWVWGFGISPFFGVYGPSHYAWWGHFHGHYPGYAYGRYGYGWRGGYAGRPAYGG